MSLYTKKSINLGTAVDTFTGDYMRIGGEKINLNFADIYAKLGDEESLFPAGAWELVTFADSPFSAEFGQAYVVDTTDGEVEINLPEMTTDDYGKSIKILDAIGNFSVNNCIIIPFNDGATISYSGIPSPYTNATPLVVDVNYSILHLIYSYDNDWKYVRNLTIDGQPLDNSSITVRSGSFIITADPGTSDPDGTFTIPGGYNVDHVEIYLNGVLQYYDEFDLAGSGYGSGVPSALTALDGSIIALAEDSYEKDDIITWRTYVSNVLAPATTYNRFTVSIVTSGEVEGQTATPTDGTALTPALTGTDNVISLSQFGANSNDRININAAQVFLNGEILTPAGIGDFVDPDQYVFAESVVDEGYDLVVFGSSLALDTDIVTIIYFNGEIGSTIPWTGIGGIKDRGDAVWLNTENTFYKKSVIEFIELEMADSDPDKTYLVNTDEQDTTATKINSLPDSLDPFQITTVSQFFDSIWPIGSVYENASNPANPRNYMGFGYWARFAVGRVTIGATEDNVIGTKFGPTTGTGTGYVKLKTSDLPLASTNKNVAILYTNEPTDPSINITGCLTANPDDENSENVAYLKSEKLNIGSAANTSIDLPTVYTYKWVRIA
jgi:hypothetical protein